MDKSNESRLTDYEKTILHSFPVLSQEELDTVNSLYKHYIFYKSVPRGREIWTSCCQRHEHMDYLVQLETPERRSFMSAAHNAPVTCPFCGAQAEMKNVGRAKSCASLREWHNVAFWHCVGNAVYIICARSGHGNPSALGALAGS